MSVLVALFECDGDPATLDEAIRTGREAVAAAGPRHAQYATCLFGLASGLFRRGELRGTLLDFDEATVLSGQAVEATPPGHTYRAMRLTLHAQAPPSKKNNRKGRNTVFDDRGSRPAADG